jgi:gluconokinase
LSRSLQPEYKNIAEYQRRHENQDEGTKKSE